MVFVAILEQDSLLTTSRLTAEEVPKLRCWMSCTTPPHRQRRRPHGTESGRFSYFRPTMATNVTGNGAIATERDKSNSTGSKTTKSKRTSAWWRRAAAPRPTMQHRNRAPQRAQCGEEWHGTWMPMEAMHSRMIATTCSNASAVAAIGISEYRTSLLPSITRKLLEGCLPARADIKQGGTPADASIGHSAKRNRGTQQLHLSH